jgi:hypothetical protein
MILRESKFRGASSVHHVIETARNASGKDVHGYRAELVQLAEACLTLIPEVSQEE